MSNYIMVRDHAVPIPQVKDTVKVGNTIINPYEEVLFAKEKDAWWRREILIEQYRPLWFEFIPHKTLIDQKSTRYDDNTGELISVNQEDTKYIQHIYEQEIRRRTYGVHFRNGKNGEIEWITGDHYFAMMWCRMQRHDNKGDFGDYLEYQRDFFYLIYLCWLVDYILGCFWSKAKKTGITNMFWLYYLNRSTLYRNKNLGYMNINQDDAAKTFMDYFMYAYNGLINPLRPLVKHKSEKEGSILFGTSYNAKKKGIRVDADMELNSNVFCKPTMPKAFDVAVMSDICFDEPTKYQQSFDEIFRTNKEAVKIQSKINGRCWAFNYTPDKDIESFREARKIFQNSELRTITATSRNQTISGLICDHIPAYLSWHGAINKYGKCDEHKALEERQMELDKVTGDRRMTQALTRQYANTKREAWASGGSGSLFDNLRLGDLLADIQLDQKSSPENDYLEGKLEWENPLWEVGLRTVRRTGEFCKVKFVPLTDEDKANNKIGKIRIYHHELLPLGAQQITTLLSNHESIMPVGLFNSALMQGKDEWGCLIPPKRYNFCMGGDPTQYAAKGEVIQGSKNAAYAISLPDLLADNRAGKIVSKLTHIEYYDRPELPVEAFEDFLKMIIWLGALAEIEANAPYVATRLMEEGLGRFMIVKDEFGNKVIWQRHMGLPNEEDKTYKLIRINTNGQLNRDQMEIMVRLIKNRFEKAPPGEKDYGPTEKSDRLLDQLMNANVEDTRLSDLFMAYGYTLECLELYIDMLIKNQNDNQDPTLYAGFLRALAS